MEIDYKLESLPFAYENVVEVRHGNIQSPTQKTIGQNPASKRFCFQKKYLHKIRLLPPEMW